MSLDFSPLSQPATKEAVEAYKASSSAGFSSLLANKRLIMTIAPVAIIFTAFIVLQIVLSGGNYRPYPFIVMVIVGGLIAAVASLIARNKRNRLAQLYTFAIRNKARLIVDEIQPGYVGAIFDEGDNRIIKEALVFSDGKEIGNYQYTKGSGKNRQTYTWGYMRVKLIRRVPHMLLDAKKNNYFKNVFSNLPASFSKNKTIKLEGNFNDYFTLYAPENYEQDAFYVFTPDVMAALIDYGANYDMEVIDDYLLFYTNTHFNLNSEDSLRKAFEVIDKISTELIDQTDYYADARTGNRAANIIAEPGRRLKSQRNITIVAVIVIFFIIWQVTGMIRMFLQFN